MESDSSSLAYSRIMCVFIFRDTRYWILTNILADTIYFRYKSLLCRNYKPIILHFSLYTTEQLNTEMYFFFSVSFNPKVDQI